MIRQENLEQTQNRQLEQTQTTNKRANETERRSIAARKTSVQESLVVGGAVPGRAQLRRLRTGAASHGPTVVPLLLLLTESRTHEVSEQTMLT